MSIEFGALGLRGQVAAVAMRMAHMIRAGLERDARAVRGAGVPQGKALWGLGARPGRATPLRAVELGQTPQSPANRIPG